jgi:hypothetical protein
MADTITYIGYAGGIIFLMALVGLAVSVSISGFTNNKYSGSSYMMRNNGYSEGYYS